MYKKRDNFRQWFDLLFAMTKKELKVRYKYTFFGFLWMVLNPLWQMVVIGFVFRFFVPVKVDNYFTFLFPGLLIWNFFSYTIVKCVPAIVYERTLIQKSRFAREIIILSLVLSNFIHLLISIVLFFVVLLTFGYHYSFLQILIIPMLLIWLLLLTIGISLFTAALNVKFRDINFIVQSIMPLLFYFTPIVFSLDLIPKNFVWFFNLNPLATMMESFRFSFIGTPLVYGDYLYLSIFVSLVIFFGGLFFFLKESGNFDDWI